MSDVPTQSPLRAHEDHPCGLCDSAGRCTFACENAESVPPPKAEYRYWALLVLVAKALDDLSQPDPQLRKLQQMHDACGRLRDEIKAELALAVLIEQEGGG